MGKHQIWAWSLHPSSPVFICGSQDKVPLLSKVTQGSLPAPACAGLALFSLLLSSTRLRLLSAMVFLTLEKVWCSSWHIPANLPLPLPSWSSMQILKNKTIFAFQCRKFRPVFTTTFLSLIAPPTPLLGPPCVHKILFSMELLILINYYIDCFLNPEIRWRNSTILTKLSELFLFPLFVSYNLVVLILV